MIEWLTTVILTFGLKSYFVAKTIELIGAILPTPLRGLFRSLLKYEVIHLGKIALIGVPVSITIEVVFGFLIGQALFAF